MEQANLDNSENQRTEATGNSGSHNDRPTTLRRIDRRYLVTEVGSVLNFDKGILYTIRELIIRPGAAVKQFLFEDRNRLVKPLTFLIVCSLIYTFLRQFLGFEDDYIYFDNSIDSTAMAFFEWVQNNYGYGNVIMGVFIALWVKIFFRKQDYNFYEILTLLCFVIGVAMIFLAGFGAVEAIFGIPILDKGTFLFVIYTTWAIGQFFRIKGIGSYVKAFFAYMLGMITFTIVVLIVGTLIDFFLKT